MWTILSMLPLLLTLQVSTENSVQLSWLINTFIDSIPLAFTEFYKQPLFYVMGHFSKLVPPGSIHIEAEASNVNVDVVAFLRPDEKVVAVLFNSGRADLDISITDTVRGNVTVNVPAHSIHTILYS